MEIDLVLARARAFGGVMDGYGIRRPEAQDIALLAVTHRVEVVEPAPDLLLPFWRDVFPDGSQRVIPREGTPLAIQRLGVLLAVAGATARPDEPPIIAEVLACLGMLPASEMFGEVERRRLAHREQLFRDTPGLFSGRCRNYLFKLVARARAVLMAEYERSESYAKARRLRDAGLNVEAMNAFTETGATARLAGDWNLYLRCEMGAAKVLQNIGEFDAARRRMLWVLYSARRQRLPERIARCIHDLFALAVESGDRVSARRYASQALRAYGRRNPALRRLAHDVCEFLNGEGRFARALPLAREVVKHAGTDGEAMSGWSTVARAAAGSGDIATFETAAAEVAQLFGTVPECEQTARSLLDVARGATMIGEHERALRLGELALEIADSRAEARTSASIRAFLQSARIEALVVQDGLGHHQERRLVARIVDALRRLEGVN